MKTFDLFNTLCTPRYGVNAGEAPAEDHIPIIENVLKVTPGDVVVSDYYNPEKASQILHNVAGLKNTLICTPEGKRTGRVWKELKSEGHLGDDLHCDYNSPRAHGVPACLTSAYKLTDHEKMLGSMGFLIREARLKTWNDNPVIRSLQLYQIERNFAFLHATAHQINKRMLEKGYSKLLLCSRDCYLLSQLMLIMYPRAHYEIEYFYTSRLTRYRPTESCAEYAKEKLSGKTLIVDLSGSGRSLKYLTERFGGDPLLVVSSFDYVPRLARGAIRETSNLAPYPMCTDVVKDPLSGWMAIYSNPTKQDWQKVEITAMRDALLACTNALNYHPRVQPLDLHTALSRMEDKALQPLWDGHHADSKAAYDMLNSGPLPHPVIL